MMSGFGTSLALLLSAGSLLLSVYTLWLTQFQRGRIRMTRPTLVFMAREKGDGRWKIFLRTHLFSTSSKGRVIESMYVRLHNPAGSFLFDFWGYGETNQLSLGSGLFVGPTGITYNHHFVLRRSPTEFLFLNGITYRIFRTFRTDGFF